MPEWTGRTVGKVRIDQGLARGGMAEVYLGTHLTLDRRVAVKVMHSHIEADADLQSRFEREAKVVAALRHPNIVQIYDFDTADGHPYIVMEYVKGPSLAAYLRRLHEGGGRLRSDQIAHILSHLAAALDYAHGEGVIHRDIKPGNIILQTRAGEVPADTGITEDVKPILTDFGLVRIAQSTHQTASGVVSGTPAYMSPEQAQGQRVDHRSDLYSLGVVLYEMLAGGVPFEGDSSWTVILKHINEAPPPIPEIAPAVRSVIDRTLEKNPADRYQTGRELANAFRAAIGLGPEAGTLPASPAARPAASTSSGREQPRGSMLARVAGYILTGLLLIALAVWGYSRIVSNRDAQSDPSAVGAGTGEPVGLLRFQDGTAQADQVTLAGSAMAPPPDGSQYEAWLIQDDGEQRISIGMVQFDAQGQGFLAFVDDQGQNLLGRYRRLEVTLEPDPDPSPNSSNDVAYSAALPQDGLSHVRHLLSAFSATPENKAFIRGLDADTLLLTEGARQMLASFETGDEREMKLQAENMLNLIVGSQSESYRDWNEDGMINDPGDGYGLLLNGDSLGYIQGTFTHADLSLTSPDATQNMLLHGEHVKISATNVGEWTPQLRDQLIAVLETSPGSAEREGMIRQAVTLADQIRNGLDINGNEQKEPIAGEGGALTAYEHAYYMADMEILALP